MAVSGGMDMSRIIRSCSLDRRTDDIAEGIPNFSKWVRGQLIAHDSQRRAIAAKARSHPEGANRNIGLELAEPIQICWPFHPSGCCVICWPDGPPLEVSWMEWKRDVKAGRNPTLPEGEGWFEGEIDEISTQRDSGPEKVEIEKKGRFKRLLIWLIQ